MLERKGGRVAFLTTKGFEDTIAIGRQARPKLYDWFQPAPECLVPKELRFGISERVNSKGEILADIDPAELERLVDKISAAGVDAIAVSLLFSFANPTNEVVVAAACERLGVPFSVSHRILPEFREYERASTVVANAYVAPKVGSYISKLAASVSRTTQRAGLKSCSHPVASSPRDLLPPSRFALCSLAPPAASSAPISLPVCRFRPHHRLRHGRNLHRCLPRRCRDGGPRISNESIITGIPIAMPMLDIHTAGAGGGSIARFDSGGLLHVGPESAGSCPGPICFGRGTHPTVTDANLALGSLDTDRFLGGSVRLDRDRMMQYMDLAKGSIPTVEEFAAGILQVVETSMEKAIRVISVERGYDPRDFTLVAFGGGGPLHACSLAHALRVPRVLVPALPGALSAVGILLADTMREYSRTVMLAIDADPEEASPNLRLGLRRVRNRGPRRPVLPLGRPTLRRPGLRAEYPLRPGHGGRISRAAQTALRLRQRGRAARNRQHPCALGRSRGGLRAAASERP